MTLALKRFVLFVVLASSLFAQSKSKTKTQKPVHVHSYARKNGKTVKAHNRALPATKTTKPKKGR